MKREKVSPLVGSLKARVQWREKCESVSLPGCISGACSQFAPQCRERATFNDRVCGSRVTAHLV
jgi:hypothetical protein